MDSSTYLLALQVTSRVLFKSRLQFKAVYLRKPWGNRIRRVEKFGLEGGYELFGVRMCDADGTSLGTSLRKGAIGSY